MATLLPFSKVAILSPAQTFTHPQNGNFDRAMQAELWAWFSRARARGADAVYARVAQVGHATALLHALLDMGGQVLAPAQLYDPQLPVLAWHSTSSDPLQRSSMPMPENDPAFLALRGRSTHSIAELQVALAEGYDYAFLSPIFATQSHPDAQALGLASLAEACQTVPIPILALGGIDFVHAQACLQAGAVGWAAIRAWL